MSMKDKTDAELRKLIVDHALGMADAYRHSGSTDDDVRALAWDAHDEQTAALYAVAGELLERKRAAEPPWQGEGDSYWEKFDRGRCV